MSPGCCPSSSSGSRCRRASRRRCSTTRSSDPRVRPLSVDVIGDIGQMLWILLGTVGFVLLIACANVANLFLVRAEGRQQELAIHAALGASWRRLTWELLSESLTLAAVGGAVGLAPRLRCAAGAQDDRSRRAAAAGGDHAGSDRRPVHGRHFACRRTALRLDPGAEVRATAPLRGAEGRRTALERRPRASPRAQHACRRRDRAGGDPPRAHQGLMIRTFQAMRKWIPASPSPEEVLTLRIAIPESLIKDEVQTARTFEQMARRIEQVPGVTSVGLSSSITMDGYDSNDPIFVEDFPTPEGRIPTIRRFKWIGENYFRTMGNRVLAGPGHHAGTTSSPQRRSWSSPRTWRASTGRIRRSRSASGSATHPTSAWRTIVGVVADARDDGVTRPAPTIVLLADGRRQDVDRRDDGATVRWGSRSAPAARTRRRSSRKCSRRSGRSIPECAGRVGPDARRDPRRVDGADVLRAGDAQHRGGSGAAAGDRRDLRRDLVHRDPAHTRDRHPDRARCRACATSAPSSCAMGWR